MDEWFKKLITPLLVFAITMLFNINGDVNKNSQAIGSLTSAVEDAASVLVDIKKSTDVDSVKIDNLEKKTAEIFSLSKETRTEQLSRSDEIEWVQEYRKSTDWKIPDHNHE